MKNLTTGHVYSFYTGYDLFDSKGKPLMGGSEVGYVSIKREFPVDLYKVSTADDSPLEISVCAVAGKNGAGKSSLIEILFAAVYLFSIESGVMKPLLETVDSENGKIPDNTFQSDKKEIELQLKAEIYFSFDDSIFVLKIGGDSSADAVRRVKNSPDDILFSEPIPISQKNIADLFFYTIAVNYSHYAWNSTHMGNWINTLFHKNDGYKTPIVLSPMRDEGDFSINDEMDRAQARLLSNIMIQRSSRRKDRQFYKVAQKHTIHSVTFTLNERKIKKQLEITNKSVTGKADAANLALDLLRVLYPEDEYKMFPTESKMIQPTLNYIYAKIVKISKTYEGFEGGYHFGEEMNDGRNNVFLNLILHEESHIAFKLRQAVNFLKMKIDDSVGGLFQEDNGQTSWEYSVDELLHWMEVPAAYDVPNLLPPSIFSIEFNFANGSNVPYPMSRLSSGELHSIHAIQTVIYHLNNLASVHMSSVNRVKYENINIILDEIELYYHPELQKRFVSDLLAAINQMSLNESRGIKALNIILLTHSPFILSDIPKENLMLMKVNEESGRTEAVQSDIQTFGGNINEILTDSFFLSDSHMGDFADGKIVAVINGIKEHQVVSESDRQLVAMIGDDYLKANIQEFMDGYDG
ncbi:AAA family ATPase [Pedobacter sp. UYP1]|uniref:AAA family ATPase n=1 Tax=Pedobacter sp. UYP1 TaxID=1756396 RepID=UPI003390E9F8